MVYAVAHEAPSERGPRTDFGGTAREGRLVEHWNWTKDNRKTIPVEVYTNCASAELFLNGHSLGEKNVADRLDPVLRWEVTNEAGVMRVIGKQNGKEAAHFELVTTGAPDHLELVPDKTVLQAGGRDLSNNEIRIVDAAGRRVYAADSTITVEAGGDGELAAMDSGNVFDVTPVQAGHRTAYEGRVLAIVLPGRKPGQLNVQASAPGLRSAKITLRVQ